MLIPAGLGMVNASEATTNSDRDQLRGRGQESDDGLGTPL